MRMIGVSVVRFRPWHQDPLYRTYTRFSQIADENEEARIWGGIHFRAADVDGRTLGRLVAEEVLRSFPRAANASPPVASR
jgi:hypothetical protein